MTSKQFLAWCQAPLRPPLVMGVLNVNPDSFFDGGRYLDKHQALAHAKTMVNQGVDIIDVGGESTRPGVQPISVDDELARVIPVIESIAATHDVMISIDTYKPEVMRAAVAVGAHLINDVFALRYPGALEAAAALDVPVCLMHMQGIPSTMQENPSYPNGVMHALHAFFSERVAACLAVGMPRANLLLDPGFGFGKTVNDNLILTRDLAEIVSTYALPVMYGCSRKHSIGAILGEDAPNRLAGGLGLAVYAVVVGARIIRTHDVLETRHALKTVSAVLDGMN